MIKKLFIVGAGVFLATGLLFGTRSVSLVTAVFHDIREAALDNVPIELELKSATQEVRSLDKEIHSMTHQIAKEENRVEKLASEVDRQSLDLDKSYANIMRLRTHLESGDTSFVSHGNNYSNREVETDLRRRFGIHKTMEATTKKMRQIVEARKKGLEAAREKYSETISAKQALEVEIANLEARLKMVEVAEAASEFNFDNSRLSKARERVNDIRTRIEVKEKIVNVMPDSVGGIPLDEPATSDDITSEVDTYFNGKSGDFAGIDD